jgi:hypothetical protein
MEGKGTIGKSEHRRKIKERLIMHLELTARDGVAQVKNSKASGFRWRSTISAPAIRRGAA